MVHGMLSFVHLAKARRIQQQWTVANIVRFIDVPSINRCVDMTIAIRCMKSKPHKNCQTTSLMGPCACEIWNYCCKWDPSHMFHVSSRSPALKLFFFYLTAVLVSCTSTCWGGREKSWRSCRLPPVWMQHTDDPDVSNWFEWTGPTDRWIAKMQKTKERTNDLTVFVAHSHQRYECCLKPSTSVPSTLKSSAFRFQSDVPFLIFIIILSPHFGGAPLGQGFCQWPPLTTSMQTELGHRLETIRLKWSLEHGECGTLCLFLAPFHITESPSKLGKIGTDLASQGIVDAGVFLQLFRDFLHLFMRVMQVRQAKKHKQLLQMHLPFLPHLAHYVLPTFLPSFLSFSHPFDDTT